MGFGRELGKIAVGFITLIARIYPPAWSYDNVIGTIWNQEQGAYDKRSEGSLMVYLPDPYGSEPLGEARGGSYDNR